MRRTGNRASGAAPTWSSTMRACSRETTRTSTLVGLVAKAADDNLLTYSSAGIAGAKSNIFAVDGNTAGTAGDCGDAAAIAGWRDRTAACPSRGMANRIRPRLCARGGYVVDIAWRSGRLSSAVITSRIGGTTPVRYGDRQTTIRLSRGQTIQLHADSFIHHASAVSTATTQL